MKTLNKSLIAVSVLSSLSFSSAYAGVATPADLNAVTDPAAQSALKAHDTVLDQVQNQVNTMGSTISNATRLSLTASATANTADTKADAANAKAVAAQATADDAKKVADAAQTKANAQAALQSVNAQMAKVDADRASDIAAQTKVDTDQTNMINAVAAEQTKFDKAQAMINSQINSRNNTQDASIKANDTAIKANAAAIQQVQGNFATKQDLSNTNNSLIKTMTGMQTAQKNVDATQDATAKGLRGDVDQNQQSINGLITDVQTATDNAKKAQDTADQNTTTIGWRTSGIRSTC